MSFSMRSANLQSKRPLSDASIRRHGDPNLNASRAALTAKSTSACGDGEMREKQLIAKQIL